MTEPTICANCKGIINSWEPRIQHPDGTAVHWFKHTCQGIKDREAEFAKEVGIVLDD